MIKGVFEKTKITCGQIGSGKTYIMIGNNHIENDKNCPLVYIYYLQ